MATVLGSKGVRGASRSGYRADQPGPSCAIAEQGSGSVTQYVSFNERAWHAGISDYFGRSACNDFSIGIELEGTDDMPYTDEQYETLAAVLSALAEAYPALAAVPVAGHKDIAPGRKTDPGTSFDWLRLDRGVAVASKRQRGGRTLEKAVSA
ncbi:MAG: 1,6-anhydro-N-acetylmuramyl-L-alanine amidase AmpD [Chromatiales bacterium]